MAKKTLSESRRSGPMSNARTLTGAQFDAALRELIVSADNVPENVGSIACERCRQCRQCAFCTDSEGLSRCQYCAQCEGCADCSHCVGCQACVACQHCFRSERCTESAYLVRCVGCSGSTYLFGCVGLHKRDFCILNEPYDRATYFEISSRLARELAIKPA